MVWNKKTQEIKELKGRTEVMPSMAARSYRMSGANGCRGASWSEQVDGKELRGAHGYEHDRNREIPVF